MDSSFPEALLEGILGKTAKPKVGVGCLLSLTVVVFRLLELVAYA